MCPPGLHITLGIFLRLFILLENDCHQLDLSMQVQGVDSGPSYGKYASALEEQTKFKDEQHTQRSGLQVLEQLLTHVLTVLSATSPIISELVTEIQQTKQRLQRYVSLKKIITPHIISTCM